MTFRYDDKYTRLNEEIEAAVEAGKMAYSDGVKVERGSFVILPDGVPYAPVVGYYPENFDLRSDPGINLRKIEILPIGILSLELDYMKELF
ncbi:hypothetical protein [Macrococcus bovicus]|uniref:Uncharacterized protein n=1 Tax=Macrococcus bovicus TaxID=69968 RepID=A0A4R6BWR0_9STAP|nr:hypothetical protein [Macrococcus bovicus]TDM12644.1 hypothetical protein ERX55_10325 [Macrococcus bovicus]